VIPLTIFERCGGFRTVRQIVDRFFDRAIDSRVVSPYFVHINWWVMNRLVNRQTKFIASLMGGPDSYSNDQIRHYYSTKGMPEPVFLAALELLGEILEEFGFEKTDVQTIRGELMNRKDLIVTRG
jgi:hemoglobin